LTANTKAEEEINKEAVQLVRELIGPVAAFRLVAAVNALPRTRSGKMARKSISDLARDKKVIVSFSMFHQKKRRLNVFSVTDPAHHRGSYGLR
jgi:AMP-binding enzyme C-terminal domain